jgi:response regulator NasT
MDKNTLHVVIADDEPIARMDLKELLKNAEYNVVAEAADGFEAVEVCKRHHPDLVLMDIKMPALDGITATRIIHDEHLADTVILLSAYGEKYFIDDAKSAGADGYLVKPIDERALIPSIELAVERRRTLMKAKRDMEKISQRLKNRSIIEKAKGLLMNQGRMTEQEAYDYMRHLSRDKSLSMRRLSEVILKKHRAPR